MRWKWFVAVGVLIIVVLIAGIYVYLNTYDYNKLKPLVARMVEDATGRRLSLDGDVNLEIGFVPALVVTDVALANAAIRINGAIDDVLTLQGHGPGVPANRQGAGRNRGAARGKDTGAWFLRF